MSLAGRLKQGLLYLARQAGENLLLSKEAPTGIDQGWVGEITYLKLKGQWQDLSTVMEVYSRRIVGWSLSSHRKTALTIQSLQPALRRRDYPKGAIFPSDRGIEYLSYEFRGYLKKQPLIQSVNRAGHCTDNAFMESFYPTLKGELIRKSYYRTVKQLRPAWSGYINRFYNTVRMHSSIG